MTSLFSSQLHDEKTFYGAFIKDLEHAKDEVYIESPFITTQRVQTLRPVLERLISKDVKVYVLTRYPSEQDENMEPQAESEIKYFENIGVQVFLAVCEDQKMFHRKLAIIDRRILWEGSLNILSQSHSREFMRRINDQEITVETFKFLGVDKVVYFL